MIITRPTSDNVAQQQAQQNRNIPFVAQQVTREEFDALKKEVAALRAFLTTMPAGSKSRAAYYREYRKRAKTDG